MVEEEIFYPAFAQATGDEQLIERARKEHQHVMELIARVLNAENLDGAVEAVCRHAPWQTVSGSAPAEHLPE